MGGNSSAETTMADVSVLTGAHLVVGSLSLATDGGSLTSASLTVNGAGSTVTLNPAANLMIGHGSAGTGVVNVLNNAALTVSSGSTVLNATGTININGGTVDLKTLTVNGGTINFIAGSLSYLGNLTVGAGGPLGTNLALDGNQQLTLSGTTTIDSGGKLTLDGGKLSTSSLVVNGTLEITGGTITGLSSLNVPTNGRFRASGIQTLVVAGVTGSVITAINNLTLGDATKVNGFYSNGTVEVGANNVTLADSNDVVFDSAALVTLGNGSSPGTLNAANGLTLDFGGNITGNGDDQYAE